MNTPEQPDHEEQDIARLLRAAGPRQEIPQELKSQWETTFRAELQPVLESRTRRSRLVMGLCASVAPIAVALWFSLLEPAAPQTPILVRHVSGEHELRAATGGTRFLKVNEVLSTGTTISTGENGFIAIVYNGYDLRINHDTRVTFQNERIWIQEGDIYASDEMYPDKASSLLIDTPHGTIRDIGTQFTVHLLPHETVATVRRGEIVVSNGTDEVHSQAHTDSAGQVTLNEDSVMQEIRVESSGAEWDWIYQGAVAYDLEGESAYEFLMWSVAESGLQLEFASEGAKMYASTTLLHGDFGQLTPEQAVDPVLATTDLRARRTVNNTLLVSLKARY